MKNIIIPTDEQAKQAIETAMPGFEVSNLVEVMPGRIWTADVQGKYVKENVFAKFSQMTGWFVNTRA